MSDVVLIAASPTLELASGRDLTPLCKLEGVEGSPHAVAFAPDGRVAASIHVQSAGFSEFRTFVQVWDTATARRLPRFSIDTPDVITMAFSPAGRILACGDRKGRIIVGDWEGNKVLATLTGGTEAITALAFSPDGRLLAAGDSGGHCKVYGIETHGVVKTIDLGVDVVFCRFLSQGTQLGVVLGNTDDLHIWDVASARKLKAISIGSGSFFNGNGVAANDSIIVASGISQGGHIQITDIATASLTEETHAIAVEDLATIDFLHGPHGEPIELEVTNSKDGKKDVERYYYTDHAGKKVFHGPSLRWFENGDKWYERVNIYGELKFEQEWRANDKQTVIEVYYGDTRHTSTLHTYFHNGDLEKTVSYRVRHTVTEGGWKIEKIPQGLCVLYYDNTLVRQNGLLDQIAGIMRAAWYEDGKEVAIRVYDRQGKVLG